MAGRDRAAARTAPSPPPPRRIAARRARAAAARRRACLSTLSTGRRLRRVSPPRRPCLSSSASSPASTTSQPPTARSRWNTPATGCAPRAGGPTPIVWPPSSHATDALLSHAYARVQYFAVVGVTPHRRDHARAALRFALDLQTAAAAATDLRPSGGALRLRIGLALGPVVGKFADAPRRRLRVTGDAGAAAVLLLRLPPPSCVLLPSRASHALTRAVDGASSMEASCAPGCAQLSAACFAACRLPPDTAMAKDVHVGGDGWRTTYTIGPAEARFLFVFSYFSHFLQISVLTFGFIFFCRSSGRCRARRACGRALPERNGRVRGCAADARPIPGSAGLKALRGISSDDGGGAQCACASH